MEEWRFEAAVPLATHREGELKRGSLEKRSLTRDRGFESCSLQQRVVQTIGPSAVELTSLILGRSVRVTSATHGEAELEDTVRALRKPGVSGRSGFSPPARAAD